MSRLKFAAVALCISIGVAGTAVPSAAAAPAPAATNYYVVQSGDYLYGIANKLVVGLSLPVVLASGDPVFNIGPDPGTLYDAVALDSEGLSWVALHAKLRLTRIEETLGLGLLLQGGLPVGARSHNLVGEPGAWFWPQAIADYQFGATGRFKVGLNAGFRWHDGENAQFAEGQLAEGAFRYGNLLTGQSALMTLDGWTWEDMTLRAPLAVHLNWPAMTPVLMPQPPNPAATCTCRAPGWNGPTNGIRSVVVLSCVAHR